MECFGVGRGDDVVKVEMNMMGCDVVCTINIVDMFVVMK
jgi:hypothetical protein